MTKTSAFAIVFLCACAGPVGPDVDSTDLGKADSDRGERPNPYACDDLDAEVGTLRDDDPWTATSLPATGAAPVEVTAVDQLANGMLGVAGDVDWYQIPFEHEGNCYACYAPYAALHGVSEENLERAELEVCTFVREAEESFRGPVTCERGEPVTEKGLTGCCMTGSSPDGFGGHYQVGEAVLWTDWNHLDSEPGVMFVRVRSLSDAPCVSYGLMYGHFRG